MPAVKMMKFRLFTNDREDLAGVPMYSCLKEVHAKSRDEALTKVPKQFDAPTFAPAVAVRWPESEQDDDEKAWLSKHVGSEWRSI